MRLHISPCPNDTFIFYAMIHGLVDCEGLSFEVCFEDIEHLNSRAINSTLPDVIKLSYAALPLVGENYRPLEVGGALGYGNGPVLVAKKADIDLRNCTIAIPGEHTTAALMLRRLIEPDVTRLKPYLFSEIAEAVVSGEVEAGVLIHEGRFTYAERGLVLLHDLGELWYERFELPIPLGVIAVRHDVEPKQIERIIRRSIEYAMANPEQTDEFVRKHAAELSDEVRSKHISYFVNEFSLGLGSVGRQAVRTLLE